LEGDQKPEKTEEEESAPVVDEGKRNIGDIVYVKKWMRTRHAIMFRLSNKIV
jgi:hypothetical protein